MFIANDQTKLMGSPLPGQMHGLNAPPQVTFEALRAEDPRLIGSLSVREVDAAPCFITTKNYSVEFYNRDGDSLGDQIYTIESKQSQDVLDVVPYLEQDGKILIAMNERIRPALAARSVLMGNSEQETKGLLWNLPGRYLPPSQTGEIVQSELRAFLRAGLGLTQQGEAHQLGGSYLPSCGASPELCVMMAVPVDPIASDAQVSYQRNFEASRCVRFIDVQAIVSGYLEGTQHDLRLVLAAFRLAKDRGYEFRLRLPLSSDSKNSQVKTSHVSVLDASEVKSLLASSPCDDSVVARIDVHEVAASGSPFIKLKRFAVTNHDREGRPLESYEADVALRRGIDAVDVGCYTWINGELCMLVKRGVRPVIAIRALNEHPLHTDPSPLGIEGIAESLEGECDLAAIRERAKQGIREEAGFEPSHQPIYAGYSYPSPGVNPERVYNFLTELIPDKPVEAAHTIDERVDLFYLSVDTLIELAEEGVIRDPRLELNAHILKAAFKD
ncbi:MAG: hypothetical protein J0M12_04300 [Deltaproteobacteria bacterium]|nr:hypothetical protein [Deltaproteobacteria bacterium]